MLADIRRKRIVELVDQFGWMHIDDLEKKLDISPATVRRDLAQLEEEQMLLRKRGGAISINRPLEKETAYDTKSLDNIEAKRCIAKEAVALIQPGMSVFMDAGTTIYEVAMLFNGIEDLTVITNDLKIALHLCNLPVDLYFLGGMVQRETGSVVYNASDGAFDFSVDIALIGASTISVDFEMFSPTQLKASMKRLIRQKARLSYLLVDASKFGKRALFRSDSLFEYSGVITNKQFSAKDEQVLKDLGVHIVSASSEAKK